MSNEQEIKELPVWKFIYEFTQALGEIDDVYIYEDYAFRFENYLCDLCNIDGLDEDEAVGYVEATEEHMSEYCYDSEDLTAIFFCEGDLYEALYYSEGFGDYSIYSKETVKKIFDVLDGLTEKYGFRYDWGGDGTILIRKYVNNISIYDEEDGLVTASARKTSLAFSSVKNAELEGLTYDEPLYDWLFYTGEGMPENILPEIPVIVSYEKAPPEAELSFRDGVAITLNDEIKVTPEKLPDGRYKFTLQTADDEKTFEI